MEAVTQQESVTYKAFIFNSNDEGRIRDILAGLNIGNEQIIECRQREHLEVILCKLKNLTGSQISSLQRSNLFSWSYDYDGTEQAPLSKVCNIEYQPF